MGSAIKCCRCKPTNQPDVNNNLLPSYNGVQILIVEGELSDAQVDAVVNSCEKPYSAQASYIMKKAGDELQAQLKSQQALRTSQVSYSAPGALKCSRIIHVALPIWTGGEDGASQDLINLRHCYIEAMKTAHDLKIKSVAFSHNCGMPALRPPSILHSQAIVLAICSYLDEKPKDLKLEKISIYTTGLQSVRIYELLVQNRLDLNNQRILKQRVREVENKFYVTTTNGVMETQKPQSEAGKHLASKTEDIKLQFQQNRPENRHSAIPGVIAQKADSLAESPLVRVAREGLPGNKQPTTGNNLQMSHFAQASVELDALQNDKGLGAHAKNAAGGGLGGDNQFKTNLDIRAAQAPDAQISSNSNVREHLGSGNVHGVSHKNMSAQQSQNAVYVQQPGDKNNTVQNIGRNSGALAGAVPSSANQQANASGGIAFNNGGKSHAVQQITGGAAGK